MNYKTISANSLDKEIIDSIKDFEQKHAVVVLFAADLLNYYGLFDKKFNKRCIQLITLQDIKVISEVYSDVDFVSYSLKIWFCLSGWNSEPYVTYDRALWQLNSSSIYCVDGFINKLNKDLLDRLEYRLKSYPKPTYLKKQCDIDRCNEYIFRLILHYCLANDTVIIPKNLNEVVKLTGIPQDIIACWEFIVDNDKSNYIFIVDTIIKYHGKSNPMYVLSDINFKIDEFNQVNETAKQLCLLVRNVIS